MLHSDIKIINKTVTYSLESVIAKLVLANIMIF